MDGLSGVTIHPCAPSQKCNDRSPLAARWIESKYHRGDFAAVAFLALPTAQFSSFPRSKEFLLAAFSLHFWSSFQSLSLTIWTLFSYQFRALSQPIITGKSLYSASLQFSFFYCVCWDSQSPGQILSKQSKIYELHGSYNAEHHPCTHKWPLLLLVKINDKCSMCWRCTFAFLLMQPALITSAILTVFIYWRSQRSSHELVQNEHKRRKWFHWP